MKAEGRSGASRGPAVRIESLPWTWLKMARTQNREQQQYSLPMTQQRQQAMSGAVWSDISDIICAEAAVTWKSHNGTELALLTLVPGHNLYSKSACHLLPA